MSDFLRKIRTLTEARVSEAKALRPTIELAARKPHDLVSKLSMGRGPRVIAEVKRASPSQGAIALTLDPVAVAREYFREGAAVISVLTEPSYFGGSLETLTKIRAALPEATLLMKDFVIDRYQLLQAREAGADAILLMISLLSAEEFSKLYFAAFELGLTPLVEVHDEAEMQVALAIGAPVIGVNNRDLRSLKISLEVSRRLSRMKPIARHAFHPATGAAGTIFISESGIETRADVDELSALGFDAFLIGSSLMKTQRPGLALRALLREKPEVKICGITRVADAVLSAELGATMIGLIFAEASPRRVDIASAVEIIRSLPKGVRAIGVFTSEEGLLETVRATGLHGVQFHNFEPSTTLIDELSGKLLIRAYALDSSTAQDAIENSNCDLVLIDAPKEAGSIPISRELAKKLNLKRRYLLAGGITPSNVSETLQDHSPWGIDLASGVETSPGIKSESKLRQFFSELARSFATAKESRTT